MSPPRPAFPAVPETAGLLLTYRCTASCDDCCFECSPQRREMLPLADALAVVDQLGAVESVRAITLSGGECFLRCRELVRILGRARQRGLATKCVTNGYWALDRDVARRKLVPLVEAGLGALELSTDAYHAPFVPFERVAHALEAAHELGLETHVIVITDRQALGLGEVLERLDLSFEPEVAREFPLLPIGFARERIPPERLLVRPGLPDGPCAEALRRPAVAPDGTVYACCAVAGFTPPLELGTLGEAPLGEILARGRDDPLHMVLSLDGPCKLAEIAAAAGVFDPEEEAFVDECHLCRLLLEDPEVVAVLRDELNHNALAYRLRRDYAEHLLAQRAPGNVSMPGAGSTGRRSIEQSP